MDNERIVCAALRNEVNKELIVCGIRHFDHTMAKIIRAANLQGSDWEQGFMTNKHRFLTRKEALELAQLNGQLQGERISKSNELYSENIY